MQAHTALPIPAGFAPGLLTAVAPRGACPRICRWPGRVQQFVSTPLRLICAECLLATQGSSLLPKPACRRRKGQIRPLPQYRRVGHGRQAMEAEAPAADASTAAAAADLTAMACGNAAASTLPAAAGGQATAVPEAGEDFVAGMSRLSMAAETSAVPNVIHFGRGRGRSLAGVSRGRGGLKAPPWGGALHAAPPPKGAGGSPRAQPKPA